MDKSIGLASEHPAARHRLLRNYRDAAKTRGLDWELPDEIFFGLLDQPCAYCGDALCNLQVITCRGYTYAYRYNGVDRKDSAIGYTEDNCVPCCGECNKAKSNTPYSQWMAWIDRIVRHQIPRVKLRQLRNKNSRKENA